MESKFLSVVVVVAVVSFARPAENVIPPESFFATVESFVKFLPDGRFNTFSFVFSSGFMESVRDRFISNFDSGVDKRLGGIKIILLK